MTEKGENEVEIEEEKEEEDDDKEEEDSHRQSRIYFLLLNLDSFHCTYTITFQQWVSKKSKSFQQK